MSGYLLGIDVGTTRLKALLFDTNGRPVSSAHQSYPHSVRSGIYSEQEPRDWWDALSGAVSRVLRELPDSAEREKVRALSLSTQGGTLVPVDREFVPVRPAITWEDTRCTQEAEDFCRSGLDRHIREAAGWKLGSGANLLQIEWMKRHEPENFRKTAYFLSVHDYLSARLTGIPALDLSNAGINRLADINRKCWDETILNALGIEENRLGKLTESGNVIGPLLPGAAKELGLPESCLLIAGGHDQYCAATGAGVIRDGDAFIATGTAWVTAKITGKPAGRYNRSRHTVPGLWGEMMSHGSGGASLEWFRENLGTSDGKAEDFAVLDERMAAVRTDGLIFYPFFYGSGFPRTDPSARASFSGLSYQHNRYHLARAILEGVCAQTAWMLEALETDRRAWVYMMGGATYSHLWVQIMTDMCGLPVVLPDSPEAGCTGAAILAGIGSGVFPGFEEGVRVMCGRKKTVYPDGDREYYRQKLEAYKEGYRKLYGNRED